MTIDEAKKRYGKEDTGYVFCDWCPISDVCDGGDENGNWLGGFEDCWKQIAKAMSEYEKPETVNHPAHYQGKHECIDEMIALFGVEAVKAFCKCNVYKYRYRAAEKNGQEDLDKADWYMDKLMELEEGE